MMLFKLTREKTKFTGTKVMIISLQQQIVMNVTTKYGEELEMTT